MMVRLAAIVAFPESREVDSEALYLSCRTGLLLRKAYCWGFGCRQGYGLPIPRPRRYYYSIPCLLRMPCQSLT